MKTLSLKLDEMLYKETEELLKRIKKPRNRYINEALKYYNQIQKRRMLDEMLERESKIVAAESMRVLSEFDGLDDARA